MGSGLTTPKSFAHSQSHSYLDDFDIIRVLQSDRLTSAFLKYLDRIGEDYILTSYLKINESKFTKNMSLLQLRLKETISDDVVFSFRHMVEEVLDTIITSSVGFKKLEDFCFLRLTDELPSFVSSHEYLDAYKTNLTTTLGNLCGFSKELKNKYKNVLIIDDSPQNSRQMSYELKANGHNVRQANHGWVGTYIATLNHFDVILIDLAMNTMDPYEVIKRIKTTNTKCNSTALIIGLNYSEYDLKSHGGILFSITMGHLEISPLDFVTGFYKTISRCAELSYDKYETSNTSISSSTTVSVY